MSSGFRLSPHLAATFLILASTLAASKLMAHRKSEMLAQPLATIGHNIAGFSGVDNPALDAPTLHALNPTSYLSRTYSNGSLNADLFVAFYAQQRAGESMHFPQALPARRRLGNLELRHHGDPSGRARLHRQ